MNKKGLEFLLVEAVAKTPYPPLGLMKISSMLKAKHRGAAVFQAIGNKVPTAVSAPKNIFVSTLFTWDLSEVSDTVNFYRMNYPMSKIEIGGVAASLQPEYVERRTGIKPYVGLYHPAESYAPDYSLDFGRKVNSSLSFTTRGCTRRCKFCSVKIIEPDFYHRRKWIEDIDHYLPNITFWDNNWLASPYVFEDIELLKTLNKKVDFNQGLDARLYDKKKAEALATIDLDPIRFAFDGTQYEKSLMAAIELTKKYSLKEIRVYVLYNYKDTPEDLYYRLNLLNKAQALAFPMEYRSSSPEKKKFPNKHWDTALLRGLKLALLFYYRRGMVTESRTSFYSIFGKTPSQFKQKLYDIYEYDKGLKRSGKKKTCIGCL